MSDSFQIVLAKLRIGQMNDLISLIINNPNRATKGSANVLAEILALSEYLVSVARKWNAVKGAIWIRLPQAAKRRGPLNSKYFGLAELLPRYGSLTNEDQVNKDAQH